jgi:hypothetical protein
MILITDRFDPSLAYHRIYRGPSQEFERVRALCLKENNWLRDNYTDQSLRLEDHAAYCVAFRKDTDEPMVMGGVFNDGRWPYYVGRMLNRAYVFPNFRSRTLNELTTAFKILHEHVIYPLIEATNFEVYFQTMQNRDKPTKGWWQVWKTAMAGAAPGLWNEQEGYLQTCPWPVQKCWQNFVYHERLLGAYAKWSPQVIDHETWINLEPGK